MKKKNSGNHIVCPHKRQRHKHYTYYTHTWDKKQIYLRKKNEWHGMAWNRQTHKYELKDKFIVFISCTVRKRPTKATKKMKENNNI